MTDNSIIKQKPRVRGIYLLPNLFTVGGMFAGFYAIIAGSQGHFQYAVFAIFIAIIMDGLDGRVARWTHSTSEMGAQMDSLQDMLSFGVAPAMVMYYWSVSILGKPGWLVAFIYTVCSALRLARFNSQNQNEDKRYFIGLNTPSSAALVASVIWTFTNNDISGITLSVAIPMAILMFLLGLLKVSTIHYRSFKDFDLRHRVPHVVILILILALALITLAPPETIFLVIFAYVISGPLGVIWRYIKPNKRKAKSKK